MYLYIWLSFGAYIIKDVTVNKTLKNTNGNFFQDILPNFGVVVAEGYSQQMLWVLLFVDNLYLKIPCFPSHTVRSSLCH